METKTITLKDGYSFTATENGNNYIPSKKIDESEFSDGNLTEVKIDDTVLTNRRYVKAEVDGKESIVFIQISDEELAQSDIKSKIEYIAMMADVDLSDLGE